VNQEPDAEQASADRVRAEDKSSQPAWYRRRAVLVTFGVLVVLAVTVISDLPVHGSRAADVSAGRSVMSEVNTDVAPCAFAVQEALTIRGDQVARSLTASDRSLAPGLLRDDQVACSFTNENIYDLSTIEVPGSAVGKRLGDLVATTTLWTTSDALGAIVDIQRLLSEPNDVTAQRNLVKMERALASDRAAALREINSADRILDTQLPRPDLPSLTAQ
jgi:hypothetical protein